MPLVNDPQRAQHQVDANRRRHESKPNFDRTRTVDVAPLNGEDVAGRSTVSLLTFVPLLGQCLSANSIQRCPGVSVVLSGSGTRNGFARVPTVSAP